MLLVDDDQAEIGEGQEQRRARADHDAHPAFGDGAPGLAPLEAGEARMPRRGRRAEAVLEALQPLRRERDLGQQHQHLPARGEGRGDGLEIDLGLAGAGHAVEQGRREGMGQDLVDQGLRGRRLLGRKRRSLALSIGLREGAAHRALDAFQQADRRHGLDHRGADAGDMRQLGGRHRRPVLQLLEHAAARGRQFQRRVAGRRRRAIDDLGLGRFERGRHAHRHAQDGARRRQGVGRDPIDEAAQRLGHRQRRQQMGDVAQLAGRHLARALAPDDADRLALAQRHDHEMAGVNRQPVGDAVVIGIRQRQRQQHADGPARHVFHRPGPRRRNPLGLWLRRGIARNCGGRRVRTTGHWGSLYEVLRRYRRRRRNQGAGGLGTARRGHHQPLADHAAPALQACAGPTTS